MNFMKKVACILILGFLFSCSNNDKYNLIGEWYRLDDWINTGDSSQVQKGFSAPRPPIYYPFGFDFQENDSVEYFLGVWEKTETKAKYLGQFRQYKLKGDSLFIYDLNKVPYRKYKIKFQARDTVEFCNDDICETFVRFKSEIKDFILIDSIKITHEDGWGKNIEYKVTSTGEISYSNISSQYEGDSRINKHGKISLQEFRGIELKYNKADFLKLTDYSGCCDGDEYTIEIFYYGNKKKRIYDYMNSGPMTFIWANRFLMTKIESKLGF